MVDAKCSWFHVIPTEKVNCWLNFYPYCIIACLPLGGKFPLKALKVYSKKERNFS